MADKQSPLRPTMILYYAAATLFLSASAYAQQAEKSIRIPATTDEKSLQELTKQLEEVRAEFQLPAIWGGRFDSKGDGIWTATGVRKVGADENVTADDLIHLGSCTKAMTAVLIAQLVSAEKLNWDTTLSELFPNVNGLVGSDWGSVTVDDLIRHRSGAPANALWWKLYNDHPKDPVASRQAILEWLVDQKRPAKQSFLYSNTGYAILGHIAEKIESKPWEEIIQEKLFKPLNITTAGFGPVYGKSELSQPWGHTANNGVDGLLNALKIKEKAKFTPIQLDNAVPLGPAGRAHMSIPDWAKFVRLFATLSPPPTELDIHEDAWKHLLSPGPVGDYAGGWNITDRPWADGLTLNHAGSNTTWFCIAWVAPKKDFFVLIASNSFSDETVKACDKVAGLLINYQAQ